MFRKLLNWVDTFIRNVIEQEYQDSIDMYNQYTRHYMVGKMVTQNNTYRYNHGKCRTGMSKLR